MSDAAATMKTSLPPGGFLNSPLGQWARANLFPNWWSTAVTLVLAYFILKFGVGVLSWAFVNAVWSVENNNTEIEDVVQAQELVAAADRALYRAKDGGRNRVHACTAGE